MAHTVASEESKQIANRAVTEGLIGMLRMSAEAGTPTVIQVRFTAGNGHVETAPYGLFLGDDADRLEIFTGQPEGETLSLSKGAIVGIKIIHAQEIVRRLNGD